MQSTASYLRGKLVLVLGEGDDAHRGVTVALAQAGADVAVGGEPADLAAEAALHSISNEVWAIGRRSTVVKLERGQAASATTAVASGLGPCDLVVTVVRPDKSA